MRMFGSEMSVQSAISWAINKYYNQDHIRILIFSARGASDQDFFVGVAFVVLASFLNLSQRSEAYNIVDQNETNARQLGLFIGLTFLIVHCYLSPTDREKQPNEYDFQGRV